MRRDITLLLMLALAARAYAVPQVSGDGACGIRAVDNESFLTCVDDRAPMPVDFATAERVKRDLRGRPLVLNVAPLNGAEFVDAGVPLGDRGARRAAELVIEHGHGPVFTAVPRAGR